MFIFSRNSFRGTHRIPTLLISPLVISLALFESSLVLAASIDEFRVAGAIKKFSSATSYSVALHTDSSRILGSNHLDTSIGVISRSSDDRPFVGFGPVWRLQNGRRTAYLEFAFRPTIIFANGLGDRDLGGNFFFSSALSSGFSFDNDWAVALRYEHISNGGLNSTNPGLDLLGIALTWQFSAL